MLKKFLFVAGVAAALVKDNAALRGAARHALRASKMPTDDVDDFTYGNDERGSASDFSIHQFVEEKKEDDEMKAEQMKHGDAESQREQRLIDANDAATNFGENGGDYE